MFSFALINAQKISKTFKTVFPLIWPKVWPENTHPLARSNIVLSFISSCYRSRGFGFVTFADPSKIEAVLAHCPHSLDGRTIDPKSCNPRSMQKPKKSNGYPKVNTKSTTARPWDIQPLGAWTSEIYGFELSPRNFEIFCVFNYCTHLSQWRSLLQSWLLMRS